MDKKVQYDKRLEPFIGNDTNHIGYGKSFKGTDFWLSTDELVSRMRAFSVAIQEAVNISTKAGKED